MDKRDKMLLLMALVIIIQSAVIMLTTRQHRKTINAFKQAQDSWFEQIYELQNEVESLKYDLNSDG